MTSPPPDLAAIRARADKSTGACRGRWRSLDEASLEDQCAVMASAWDVPALLAHIDALTSEHAATVARLEVRAAEWAGIAGANAGARAESDAEVRRLNETIDETPSAYAIADRMRREFPQNKHAQQWADWIDKQAPTTNPEDSE